MMNAKLKRVAAAVKDAGLDALTQVRHGKAC
jgi:hypothetical protein